MLLGHRSKTSPLFRIGVRREFTMAYLLCQVANITIHQLALTRSLTNTIEATGMYSTLTKESKYVAAHASVSVEIR
jgi:hypothetical protein